MSRSTLATLTHDLWLVCCGRLTHRMLPGWCLCMPDSNLGPVLPAGREPALFPTSRITRLYTRARPPMHIHLHMIAKGHCRWVGQRTKQTTDQTTKAASSSG